jgi:tetratricopeptide (TPR) repeat protein
MINTRLAHYTDAVQAYTSAISSFCETTEPSKVEKITNSLRQKKRNLSRFNHSVTESFIKKLNINDKANVVEKQKYREQVEDTIDSVFTVKLNKDDILNNRALAYANAGNYLEAIFDLEQIEEESHQFLFNLGFVHYFNNNYTCAQEYIIRAIELAGDSVPSMYSVYLACVLERTNQLDQAETIRKNLLVKHPHMVVRPFHYKFLPDSVMMNVASFLDHKSLLNLGRTCRALQTLTKHHSLWDNIQCTHNQCTFQTKFDKYIEFVLARSETIERVSIPYIMEPVPQIANRKLKSFYTIIFNSNCMSHVLDLLNKNDISQIESFSFDMRSYNDDIALECSRLDESNFTHLRKLDLSGVTIKLEKWEKILFVCGKNLVSCSWKGNNKYIQDLVERMCPQLGFKEKNSMEKVVYTLKSYSK